ncbi:Glutaredoxin [Blastococcus aurantiacus]|uniref:Glutaredoxin n=1 Tax=Blastococcus aurantiacus TaxID=1550231 RepID=A0A1G7R2T2_9ACTN|nr:glutaredoxin domain-containing protein [Blastococcus aurantiacus]SDG05086.1 Glutaredoxin [Blastococcus aurantiacus]
MNPTTQTGHASDELVVYGTGWCPDVRRSRAVLDSAGIAYRYIDLEADPTATRLVRRLQKGRRRIPTIVWPDGSHLVEPTDGELQARLDQP